MTQWVFAIRSTHFSAGAGGAAVRPSPGLPEGMGLRHPRFHADALPSLRGMS